MVSHYFIKSLLILSFNIMYFHKIEIYSEEKITGLKIGF